MKHSDQGMTRTQRGEEQPADKERAQTAPQTNTPSRPHRIRKHARLSARFRLGPGIQRTEFSPRRKQSGASFRLPKIPQAIRIVQPDRMQS